MKFGRNIRCILFDLGSTLWTAKDERWVLACERIANLRSVMELFRFAGSNFLPDIDVDELGKLLRKSVERQIRVYVRQNPEYEPDFAQVARDSLQQLGVPGVTRQFGDAIYEALRVRIPDSRALFDDALPTLTALKERGYILGVVTNRHYGGALFQKDLQTMGMLEYFDYRHMAISADLGIRKPHPDIFWHALNGLHVAPEEAAMVGDTLKADITGAKKLDLLAIWVPKTSLRAEARSALLSSLGEDDPVLTDDSLLAYTRQTEKKGRQTPEGIRPDVIIERLSDLLAIF